MEIAIRIILTVIIVYSWNIGGKHNGKWVRFYFIPVLLGIFFAFKRIWLLPMMFLAGQSFRIGYGNYEIGEKNCWLAKLTKDKNGWWIRGIWGLLIGLVFSLPFGVVWWFVLLNGLLSFLASYLKIVLPWADYIVGLGISSILFLRR